MKTLLAAIIFICCAQPLLAQSAAPLVVSPSMFTVIKNGRVTTPGVDTWYVQDSTLVLEADAGSHSLEAELGSWMQQHDYLEFVFDITWKNDTASNGQSNAAALTLMMDNVPYFTVTTPLVWKWAAGQALNGAVTDAVSFKEQQVQRVHLVLPVAHGAKGLLSLQVQGQGDTEAKVNDDFYISNIQVKAGVNPVAAVLY